MIRKATPADFDFVHGLYMHPEINPWLLYEPMEALDFLPVYTGLLDKNIKYIYSSNNMATGMFKLVPYTYRASHISYLGAVAVHPHFAGKGTGFTMLQEIIAFARQQGCLRIELSVACTNNRAIHLYEKVGFKKEGVLRKYTHLKKEGVFLDEVLMSYLWDDSDGG